MTCQRQDVSITVDGGPSIRGRDRERNGIDACLDEARRGRFAVVRMLGEPGVGKTFLCDYAAEAARPDFEVVRATGVEGEAALPLASLSVILRCLATHSDGLSISLRRIVDAILAAGDARVDDPFALGAAVLGVLSAASESRPLLLIVDDAHWLDDPSVAALSFALRRLAVDAIAVVIAGRPAGTALAGLGETLRLVGLEDADARGLLIDQASDFAPNVADAVVMATGGIPLALVEVALQLSAEQRSGAVSLPDPLPVGDHMTESYRRLLVPLPDDCRLVLATVAAAGSARTLVEPALHRLGLTLAHS